MQLTSPTRGYAIAAASLVILVAAAYYNGLQGPFLFDDVTNILRVPANALNELNFSQLRDVAFTTDSKYPDRGLARISFAINYYLAGGEYNVLAYKLTNLGIHILSAFLLWFLAHRLLAGMVSRNGGGILNVSSVAGYQAAPYQSAYAGTKAYVLGWSDGLHQEYKHTNVAITALCPGVTDTEFFEAAGYRKLTGFLKYRMDSQKVARIGLEALRRGRMEALPGLLNKSTVFLQRFLPRRAVASLSRRLMGGRPMPTRKK